MYVWRGLTNSAARGVTHGSPPEEYDPALENLSAVVREYLDTEITGNGKCRTAVRYNVP